MIQLTITGNLTKDPVYAEREYVNKTTGEIKKASVCNFTVAANDGYGESQVTGYFKVSAWRGLAETCSKYLKKGRQVLVVGPVKMSNYIDANHNVHTGMEIRAKEVQFLGGGRTDEPKEESKEEPKEEKVYEEFPY